MARPGLGGASVRRRAVRAGTRQAANEFAACYAKPAEAGCATPTGFSRFRIGQAVNSFMADICATPWGWKWGWKCNARCHLAPRRGAERQAANEFAACYAKPAEAGCATTTGFSRFRIGQAVNSFMAGIHGQARSRRRERTQARRSRGYAAGSE